MNKKYPFVLGRKESRIESKANRLSQEATLFARAYMHLWESIQLF